jgi:hypothetical protein
MANHGPMHWRGDRTGGNDAPSAQPDAGTYDERAAFRKFQGGFTQLLGRNAMIAAADMDAFAEFILQLAYPPNPNRSLSNSLTPDQDAGRAVFEAFEFTNPTCPDRSCGPLLCTTCHATDPTANPGTGRPGFFGTSGLSSFDFHPQVFKIPHLRNLYQKIGMFGSPRNPGFIDGDNGPRGDQVRGFGFQHDGAVDTLFRFHQAIPFSDLVGSPGLPSGPEGNTLRRQLEAYMLVFPTNLAPIVGQQITLTASSPRDAVARADLIRQRADAGDCDLVVKAELSAIEAGFLYLGGGLFATDRRAQPAVNEAIVRREATRGHAITYTCVPPGSGERIAVDRDGDGSWDGDERDAGTDPADPTSRPTAVARAGRGAGSTSGDPGTTGTKIN